MGYKAVVIDNNVKELSESVAFLVSSGEFEQVIPFADSREAVAYIDKHGCDILFTEIEMTKINGFDLAIKYRKSNVTMCFAFLSHNKNYGLDAFSLGITDYIIKPLQCETLSRIVTKLKNGEYFNGSQKKF